VRIKRDDISTRLGTDRNGGHGSSLPSGLCNSCGKPCLAGRRREIDGNVWHRWIVDSTMRLEFLRLWLDRGPCTELK
jgi:hypothetical protein